MIASVRAPPQPGAAVRRDHGHAPTHPVPANMAPAATPASSSPASATTTSPSSRAWANPTTPASLAPNPACSYSGPSRARSWGRAGRINAGALVGSARGLPAGSATAPKRRWRPW